MNEIFCVGDWHFNHNKNFIYKERGFSSIQEHDQKIIEIHNSIVAPTDTVYVLGDCGLGTDIDYIEECIKAMNGKFYLAFGNHDSPNKINHYRTSNRFEAIEMGYIKKLHKSEFVLTHYLTVVSCGDDQKPVYNIHAHTHQKQAYTLEWPKNYCVSLDATNLKPINIEEIYQTIRIANYNWENKYGN